MPLYLLWTFTCNFDVIPDFLVYQLQTINIHMQFWKNSSSSLKQFGKNLVVCCRWLSRIKNLQQISNKSQHWTGCEPFFLIYMQNHLQWMKVYISLLSVSGFKDIAQKVIQHVLTLQSTNTNIVYLHPHMMH